MSLLGFLPNCQTTAMGIMPHTDIEELTSYFEKADDPQTFRLTKEFSLVYHRFLERDLSHYPAIRGQMISPISLGLKVIDQDQKSIIYHEEVSDETNRYYR
jgi:hypothetical protein